LAKRTIGLVLLGGNQRNAVTVQVFRGRGCSASDGLVLFLTTRHPLLLRIATTNGSKPR
jgi:hypothetical protein